MMIDQELPALYVDDLIACAGEYIDLAKIKTGTARLYPERVLRAKLEHGVVVDYRETDPPPVEDDEA